MGTRTVVEMYRIARYRCIVQDTSPRTKLIKYMDDVQYDVGILVCV